MNGSSLTDVMERAAGLGVRVELESDSSLLVAKPPASSRTPYLRDPYVGRILQEIANYLDPIRPLLQGRTIAARSQKLAGSRIFFADGEHAAVLKGTLQDSGNGNGNLIVSVHNPQFPKRPLSVNASADTLLILLSSDEAGAASVPRREREMRPKLRLQRSQNKIDDLISRAGDLGLQLAFDSGLLVVRLLASGEKNADVQDMLEQVARFSSPIRRLLEKRTIVARGKELIGQRILFVDVGWVLEGTLREVVQGGEFVISVDGIDVQDRRSASVENLIVLMREDASR